MAGDCPHCDAEIVDGEDFCRACGHGIDYAGDSPATPALDREDHNSGDVCPGCGATHMVATEDGGHRCETCGFCA